MAASPRDGALIVLATADSGCLRSLAVFTDATNSKE
jgi:hypothetical protein